MVVAMGFSRRPGVPALKLVSSSASGAWTCVRQVGERSPKGQARCLQSFKNQNSAVMVIFGAHMRIVRQTADRLALCLGPSSDGLAVPLLIAHAWPIRSPRSWARVMLKHQKLLARPPHQPEFPPAARRHSNHHVVSSPVSPYCGVGREGGLRLVSPLWMAPGVHRAQSSHQAIAVRSSCSAGLNPWCRSDFRPNPWDDVRVLSNQLPRVS
jgi:hypothetical protein